MIKKATYFCEIFFRKSSRLCFPFLFCSVYITYEIFCWKRKRHHLPYPGKIKGMIKESIITFVLELQSPAKSLLTYENSKASSLTFCLIFHVIYVPKPHIRSCHRLRKHHSWKPPSVSTFSPRVSSIYWCLVWSQRISIILKIIWINHFCGHKLRGAIMLDRVTVHLIHIDLAAVPSSYTWCWPMITCFICSDLLPKHLGGLGVVHDKCQCLCPTVHFLA